MVASRNLRHDESRLALLIPSETELGPAMKALGERHRLFVIGCLELGSRQNYSKAASFAGFAGDGRPNSDATLRVTGHRLAHDPRIQAALLEEAQRRLQAGTVAAASLLVEQVGNQKLPPKLRQNAAAMILDRGGLPSRTEHKVTVNHVEDRAAKIKRVHELALLTGNDPKQLLGSLADVVEGDFVMLKEVEDGELVEGGAGSAGAAEAGRVGEDGSRAPV